MIALATLVYLGYTNPEEPRYYTAAWLMLVFLALWFGNQGITRLFNKYFSWQKYGRRRFFMQLGAGLVFSLLVINAAYLIFKYLFTEEPPVWSQVIVMNVWGFVMTVPSYSVYFGLLFLRHWQRTQLEVERYQKETMASQLVNLKNHLDPHFLFNNLNILSSLIDKDKELSQEFLVRFAEVYRSLLLNKGEDLVTLEEELEFIQSYIFLLEVRFERNIQFNINVTPESHYFMIPPLTVQMLVENAIKHNIITEKRPLIISITTNGQRLHITNSLFEKREDLKSRSGTGLKNIKARFKYFCDEELSITKTAEEFRVSVPLLEIETL